MKKVTYLEELLLGRVQFSLQKGPLQFLLKKHVVRKINPTYNDKTLVWCTVWLLHSSLETLKYSFHNSTPVTTRSFPLKVKLLYQRDSSSSILTKKLQTAHALERALLCK